MTDQPKCPKCNGAKWLYTSNDQELISTPCVCLEREMLRKFLGDEIFYAKRLRSELYTPDRDATQENLFIKGTWDMVCRHFKWVLSAKRAYGSGFNYRIVGDDKLTRVWLGYYARNNQALDHRDKGETWNTLEDLLADPHLVIIKMGVIRRNKAVPDILLEALQVRSRMSKPTWIVEGIDTYAPGHNAFSDELFAYITGQFKTFDAGGDLERARQKELNLQEALQDVLSNNNGAIDADDMPSPRALETYSHSSTYSMDFEEGPLGGGKKKKGYRK